MFITHGAPSRTRQHTTQTVERDASIVRWAPERNVAAQVAHLLWLVAMIALVSACLIGAMALYP